MHLDAQYWMLGAGALGQPRGMEWGGRWEEWAGDGSGCQVALRCEVGLNQWGWRGGEEGTD